MHHTVCTHNGAGTARACEPRRAYTVLPMLQTTAPLGAPLGAPTTPPLAPHIDLLRGEYLPLHLLTPPPSIEL